MDASSRLERLGMSQKEFFDELHMRRYNISERAVNRYFAGNAKMHTVVVDMILMTLNDLEELKGIAINRGSNDV